MTRIGWGMMLVALLSGGGSVLAQDGLLLHYPCDEGQGDTLADASDTGRDVKLLGPGWASGDYGSALKLDGVDDYVDCGPVDPALGKSCTLTLWAMPEALQGGLFSASTGGGRADERLVLAFNTYRGEPVLLGIISDGENYQYLEAPLPEVGKWTHLAMTLDGRHVSVSVNGVRIRSRGQRVVPQIADVPLLIGRCSGLGSPFFKGLVDDVRVYGRALPDVDVLQVYKGTAEGRGVDPAQFATPKLALSASAQSGRLLVSADCVFMRPLPEGAKLGFRVARGDHALKRASNARRPAVVVAVLMARSPCCRSPVRGKQRGQSPDSAAAMRHGWPSAAYGSR